MTYFKKIILDILLFFEIHFFFKKEIIVKYVALGTFNVPVILSLWVSMYQLNLKKYS